jgi:hypothetical protein
MSALQEGTAANKTRLSRSRGSLLRGEPAQMEAQSRYRFNCAFEPNYLSAARHMLSNNKKLQVQEERVALSANFSKSSAAKEQMAKKVDIKATIGEWTTSTFNGFWPLDMSRWIAE